jgi:uncharacterized small protein (DUF1192 family)
VKIRCPQCWSEVNVQRDTVVEHKTQRSYYQAQARCEGSAMPALPIAISQTTQAVAEFRSRIGKYRAEIASYEKHIAALDAEIANGEATLAKLRKRATTGGAA